MHDASDHHYLSAFLGGDRSSFTHLIEKYHTQVYRLAYKFTSNQKDAEDVTQDCFLKAYENLLKHPKTVNFKPWIMTICVNLCRNLAKKKKSFNFSDLERVDDEREFQDSLPSRMAGPRELVLSDECAKRVQEALQDIPKKYQVVIHLRYVQDLSYNEIAQSLNLPINTVKVQLNRAKKHLKTLL